jgi:hypothetical protein
VPIRTRWQTDLRAAPPVALWPGLAGLLPFVGGVVGLWIGPAAFAPWLWKALIGYGAIILTFVGAIHWGIALGLPHGGDTDPSNATIAFGYGWSVLPALLGWLAILLPPGLALGLLVAGFAVQLFIDARIAAAHRLPAWYLALRLLLTAVVITCLLLALPA